MANILYRLKKLFLLTMNHLCCCNVVKVCFFPPVNGERPRNGKCKIRSGVQVDLIQITLRGEAELLLLHSTHISWSRYAFRCFITFESTLLCDPLPHEPQYHQIRLSDCLSKYVAILKPLIVAVII